MPQHPLVCRPGIKAFRRLADRAPQLSFGDRRGERGRQCLRDLILHGEDVGQIAIVALGPDVISRFTFDQLRSDPDPIAGLAHAAFEHIAHAELPADLFHVDRTALVSKGGVPGDDEQRGIMRKNGDHVFGNAVRHEFLLGVTTHVREGQNGH